MFRNKNKSVKITQNIGEIRKSQLISTFGIGSVVDFVKDTAIIAGVDDWDKDNGYQTRKISNENLQAFTGAKFFLEPKVAHNIGFKKSDDVLAHIFPQKLYCPKCKSIINYREVINQQNKHRCNRDGDNGKKCNGHLVASRFVLICENGHMEDFPYSWWVHHGKECASNKPSPRIKMYNIGNRSDAESLMLECTDCKAKRSMVGVFNKNAFAGENGKLCCGIHPHLKNYQTYCQAVPKTRLRSSTGVYFPITQSALLIPPWSSKAVGVLKNELQVLEYMPDESKEKYITDRISPRVPEVEIKDLLEIYKLLKNNDNFNAKRTEADIYVDEYKVLCKKNLQDDRFSSHSVEIPNDFKDFFDTVTAVDRLVVTMAISGFTRLYPYNGEDNSSRIVPLSTEKKNWLPAVEMNGEGIFIKFKKSAIDKWIVNIGNRYDKLNEAYKNTFFNTPKYSNKYVLLHTFAHLFIRQLANECGYSVASMSEKIYSTFTDGSNDFEMEGILVYLSSSDSDGSLGGLISVVENTELFDKVLKNMLKEARWCSGDPICYMSTQQGFASLNYAACHACTLLPETSCEFRNLLLDRVSIVGTPDNPNRGIMGDLTKAL